MKFPATPRFSCEGDEVLDFGCDNLPAHLGASSLSLEAFGLSLSLGMGKAECLQSVFLVIFPPLCSIPSETRSMAPINLPGNEGTLCRKLH